MERIGEYLVTRLVGEGGMGKVYEAEERLSKRKVALKVLRPELTRHEEGRRLFLNEMQILAHLEHPGIVRSLASMEVDGQLVMALEFLEGKTLRAAMNAEGRFAWTRAVEIVTAIASALACAHSQAPPIIHRDLKPENVMLTSDAHAVKVMDFGIAKVLESAQATNTQSIGTLQYMSPEQIDARTIDARSDLYSLGLMLYEMLAGAPPFRSASPRELLNMQCTTEPPELDDDVRVGLPRGVEALLYELLAKSPDDRPDSATEVVERLAAFAPAAPRSRKTTSVTSTSTFAPTPAASPRGEAPKTSSRPSDVPSLAPSSKREPPKPSTDTVALVERATASRHVPTPMALMLIVLISLVAGFTVYFVRVRAAAPSDAPSVASTATNAKR